MSKTVRVGDADREVRPFRAFKVLYAGVVMSRISKEIREVLNDVAEFERDYRVRHTLPLTKELAVLRGYPLEMFGDKDVIDIPKQPSAEERFLAGFPKAFAVAREEVMMLLALIVIPDSDLRAADEADDVEVVLLKLGKQLVYDAEWTQIAELALAAHDEIKASAEAKSQILGKLTGLFKSMTRQESKPATEQPQATPSESEPSSTSSPEPTDGAESESSSASVGATSSA